MDIAKKLNETLDTLKYAVNKQTNEIKAYNPHQFLNSPFGKHLQTALIKQYINIELLVYFRKELLKNRDNRNKDERNTFISILAKYCNSSSSNSLEIFIIF